MSDEYITRSEYEAREAIRGAEITKLDAKVDLVNSKTDTIINEIRNMKFIPFKILGNAFLAFIGGGGLVAIIEFIIQHR